MLILALAALANAQVYNGDFEASPGDDGWSFGITDGTLYVTPSNTAPSPLNVLYEEPGGISYLGWVWADSTLFVVTQEQLSVFHRESNVDAYFEVRDTNGQLTSVLLADTAAFANTALDVSAWCGQTVFARLSSTRSPLTTDNWVEFATLPSRVPTST